VVMLNNGAIAWKSRRQPTVALSTMEAEYMALSDATKELKWVRTLLAELGYSNKKSADDTLTVLFSDSQSAIALAKNPVSHARAKHIDIRHHFVREAIQDKVIWAGLLSNRVKPAVFRVEFVSGRFRVHQSQTRNRSNRV
jgi:hypothetical protein